MRTIELTQMIRPAMPVWPRDPQLERTTIATIEKEGYLLKKISLGEHSGTHFGVPAHCLADGLTVERVPPEDLIAPGVVLDIRQSCTLNPDYTLAVVDINAWESEYGSIPPRSYVLVLTGWSRKWADPSKYFGFSHDGSMHFPGFSTEAVIYLMEERKCLGLGIDTHGIEPGCTDDLRSNTALFKRGGYHLENLANLEHLPARNFTLFIGPLPVEGGSGSPARVLAQCTEVLP